MLIIQYFFHLRRMNKVSLFATILLCCVLLTYRLWRSDLNDKPLKLTTYDAFGYYMYLPKLLIYKDLQLSWLKPIDAKYHVVGGDNIYQAGKVFYRFNSFITSTFRVVFCTL